MASRKTAFAVILLLTVLAFSGLAVLVIIMIVKHYKAKSSASIGTAHSKGTKNETGKSNGPILKDELFWSKIPSSSLKDVEEFRSWIIKDVPGDGRCGYWAILQSLWDELANPNSEISKQFWTIDERKDVNYQNFVDFDKMKEIKQKLSGILGKYIDIFDFIVKTRVEEQNVNSGDLVLFMKYKMIICYYNENSGNGNPSVNSGSGNPSMVINMSFLNSQTNIVSDNPNERFKKLIENEALFIDQDLLILVVHAFNLRLCVISIFHLGNLQTNMISSVVVDIFENENKNGIRKPICIILETEHYKAAVRPKNSA